MSSTDSCVVKPPRAGPDLQRALFEELRAALRPLKCSARAAERVGCAGAALVEDEQVAVPSAGRDRLGDEFAERQRRLSGPPASATTASGSARAGELALEAQRDRSRHAARPTRAGRGSVVQENAGVVGAQGMKLSALAAGAWQGGEQERERAAASRVVGGRASPPIAAAASETRHSVA